MPTVQINKSYSLPGTQTLQTVSTRSADAAQVVGGSDAPITLNAAKAISDYAEGDPNVVTGNLTAGHGQTDGTFDFYWTESGVAKCRYGVPVTFSTNALTTTSDGAGDNFPSTGGATSPVLCKQKVVNATIDGDNVSVFWAALKFGNVAATGRGHVAFEESDATAVGAINVSGVTQGTAVADYDIAGGASNPLTGEVIGLVKVSHNDTTYTPTFELCVLSDSTP